MISNEQRFIIIAIYVIAFILIGLYLRGSSLFFPFLFTGIILAHAIKKHFFTNQK
ncbi:MULTISPECIES: hypothetical protein [Vagococcus]|uniref:hypothetical protein n=1 Tax=Vagococcus TaxID=2737 RepID=UPI002FC8D454